MRVLVTGAAGLTGEAVVRHLLRRGHQVIGVTRRPGSASLLAGSGADVVVADCSDPSALRPLLDGVDGLVHVAGVLLGSDVARAGIDGIKRVIVVSTAAVYSRAHPAAAAYARHEEALRRAAPDLLAVRPTMIYGSPRDRNIHKVIAFAERWRMLPLPSGGRSILQPIHYADLAAAVAALVDLDARGTVDAGGPTPITVRQVAEAIFAALRRPAIVVPVPLAAALPAARAVDRATGSRWEERLLRLREDRSVDNARLLALTGCRLRPFEQGVREEIEMTRGQ